MKHAYMRNTYVLSPKASLASINHALKSQFQAGGRHRRDLSDVKKFAKYFGGRENFNMKTIVICHKGDLLTNDGFARWLSSFSDLQGILQIDEDLSRPIQRLRAEISRSGWLRFMFDILPYQLYSRLFHGRGNRRWIHQKNSDLSKKYPGLPFDLETLVVKSPNSPESVNFVSRLAPDLVIARCKTLICKDLYSIPRLGTFVLHPGICPEYRNAHGCFWALANDDSKNVGATLLRIDDGIDTGPVFGHFRISTDACHMSPGIIQERVVYDNLDDIRDKLLDIRDGKEESIDTSGRASGLWGQPWFSHYLKIRLRGMRK